MVGGGVCGIWRPGEGGLGEGERRASRVSVWGAARPLAAAFSPGGARPTPRTNTLATPPSLPFPGPAAPSRPPRPRPATRYALLYRLSNGWVARGAADPGRPPPGDAPPPPRAGPRFGKQKQRWRVRGCLPPACWAGQGPGGRPRAALQTATGRPAHPPTRLQGGLVERAGGPRARAAGGAPRVPMPRQRRGAGAPSARPHQGLARAGTPTRR